jgi:hypothetical protein
MFELKDCKVYTALLLGLSNMIIGCTSKILFESLSENIGNSNSYVLRHLSFALGALFSEYFCKKFGRRGLTLIWIGFLFSSLLVLPDYLVSRNETGIVLGIMGISLCYVLQPIMIIFQVKCLKDIIKSNNKTYSLAVLYSLNQSVWVINEFIGNLKPWLVLLVNLIGIIYSIIISFKFQTKKNLSIVSQRKTILPFSAFAVESLSYGVSFNQIMLSAFDISNMIAGSDMMISFCSFGYIMGTFLVIFLMNFRNHKIIVFIIASVPLVFLACYLINSRQHIPGFKISSLILINVVNGMLEVLNINLIVFNSNRPEFFIGMLYFISYLARIVITNLYM